MQHFNDTNPEDLAQHHQKSKGHNSTIGMEDRAQSLTERMKKLNDKFLNIGKKPNTMSTNIDSVNKSKFQLPQITTQVSNTIMNKAIDQNQNMDDCTTDDEQFNESNSPIISGRCQMSPSRKKSSDESSLSQDSPIIGVSSDRSVARREMIETPQEPSSKQISMLNLEDLEMTEIKNASHPKPADAKFTNLVPTSAAKLSSPKAVNICIDSRMHTSESSPPSADRFRGKQVLMQQATVAQPPKSRSISGIAVSKSHCTIDIAEIAIKKFSVFSNGQISKTLLRSGFTAPELRAVCEFLGEKLNIEDEADTNLATLGKEALVQLALLRLASENPSALAPACINQSQAPSKKRKQTTPSTNPGSNGFTSSSIICSAPQIPSAIV